MQNQLNNFKNQPEIRNQLKAVVIGGSAGSIEALGEILPCLPSTYSVPIVIVLHILGNQPSLLSDIFAKKTKLRVKEADEKEAIQPGTIYFAPPGYHLLVERDLSFSLSVEAPVNYSRPSIDVLFESAADAFRNQLVGVLLTGASCDGAAGLKCIQDLGGLIVIQDPATAQARLMPEAGCASTSATDDQILSIKQLAEKLISLDPSESDPK